MSGAAFGTGLRVGVLKRACIFQIGDCDLKIIKNNKSELIRGNLGILAVT